MNRTPHIYLYAKKWYNWGKDPIADVQEIIKKTEGIAFSRIEVCHIVYHLAIKHVLKKTHKSDSYHVDNFITDLSPENTWKVGYINKQNSIDTSHDSINSSDVEYNFWDAVFYKSMSILRLSTVKEIDIELGNPDPNVFELSESAKANINVIPKG